ncbi:MAG: hypothetical protein D4R70_01385 [Betaproteobacteria bacterium]|nr:MAG: hypothetical protein D4R70_01385 [Betaproteobacteria bacterium]
MNTKGAIVVAVAFTASGIAAVSVDVVAAGATVVTGVLATVCWASTRGAVLAFVFFLAALVADF